MKRLEGESFDDYRLRRKEASDRLKKYLKGYIIWNNGTYIKKIYGPIGFAGGR